MFVFSRAVLFLTLSLPAFAQAQGFATVTIRPARSADPRDYRVRLLPSGDWTANGTTVGRLMTIAYGMPSNGSARFSRLPDWTLREKYDIVAKAPAGTIHSDLSDDEIRSRIRQMVRRLLTERFGLAMRIERKPIPVYALTVASNGPKVEKSLISQQKCAFNTGPEECHSFAGGVGHPLNAKAINMEDLAQYIENWTDLPVVNHTALSGLFTLNTQGWVPMRLPPPPPGVAPGPSPFAGLPTIFTVLSTVGLELRRQEETLPVYTVERVEHPATN